MVWLWATLMPHPPVLIPAVGRGRENEAAETLGGIAKLQYTLKTAHETAAKLPEVLLLSSPHQPYVPGKLFVNIAPQFSGSFSPFGVPAPVYSYTTHQAALAILRRELEIHGIPAVYGDLPELSRDHGSLVPLYFLQKIFSNDNFPQVILLCPSGLSPEMSFKFGQVLAQIQSSMHWAFLGSGDLSHRLFQGAPGGYHQSGEIFDKAVLKALADGNAADLLNLPENVRENAGECGLRSVLALLGLCNGPLELLSYEGPFGVGYCNAVWLPENTPQNSVTEAGIRMPNAHDHPFAKLARLAVSNYLSGKDVVSADELNAVSADSSIWQEPQACFVSIKNKNDGSLRGCIGTILPDKNHLFEEILSNAIAAATKDGRFSPMHQSEVEKVRFSVDVLSTPELLDEDGLLDPTVYGVIVSKAGRRGLLLPDLPGVDSIAVQLAIAARKAGISDLDGATIERFTVSRYYED